MLALVPEAVSTVLRSCGAPALHPRDWTVHPLPVDAARPGPPFPGRGNGQRNAYLLTEGEATAAADAPLPELPEGPWERVVVGTETASWARRLAAALRGAVDGWGLTVSAEGPEVHLELGGLERFGSWPLGELVASGGPGVRLHAVVADPASVVSVLRGRLRPSLRSLQVTVTDVQVGDPALMGLLEAAGQPPGAWVARLWPDDDAPRYVGLEVCVLGPSRASPPPLFGWVRRGGQARHCLWLPRSLSQHGPLWRWLRQDGWSPVSLRPESTP